MTIEKLLRGKRKNKSHYKKNKGANMLKKENFNYLSFTISIVSILIISIIACHAMLNIDADVQNAFNKEFPKVIAIEKIITAQNQINTFFLQDRVNEFSSKKNRIPKRN